MIEGDEFYEAVRFVFENQLMQAAEDTFFDTESGALVQDMAYALYVLGFGAAAPDADTARSDLGQYGIMSSCGNNEDALTAAAAQDALSSFSSAVSVPYRRSPDAADAALSRGELAQLIKDYCDYLEEL